MQARKRRGAPWRPPSPPPACPPPPVESGTGVHQLKYKLTSKYYIHKLCHWTFFGPQCWRFAGRGEHCSKWVPCLDIWGTNITCCFIYRVICRAQSRFLTFRRKRKLNKTQCLISLVRCLQNCKIFSLQQQVLKPRRCVSSILHFSQVDARDAKENHGR